MPGHCDLYYNGNRNGCQQNNQKKVGIIGRDNPSYDRRQGGETIEWYGKLYGWNFQSKAIADFG
jgi:hypothetical protein